jgi:hypothetical protein
VRDVLGVGENGQPIFTDEKSDAYGLSDWVFLSKTQMSLRAGETIEVPFEVRVPLGAIPGGHFGGIFVATKPEKQDIIGSSIGAQVGTIVSLRVTGDVIEEARIREFHSDKSIYSKPEVNFTIRIENLGNVLIRPRGTIEIDNMFGRRVAQLDVNKESVRIFPRSERSFISGWVGQGLAFGRYQALISMVYGEDQKKTISHAVSFWILPLKEIGLIFIVIVILSICLISFFDVVIFGSRPKLAGYNINASSHNACNSEMGYLNVILSL